MNVVCIGVNWRTPVELRERISFRRDQLSEAYEQLRQRSVGSEFTLLSTCNRTELYAADNRPVSELDTVELIRFLAESRGLEQSLIEQYLYRHEGKEAVHHLFRVAGGLDSLVLGEAQIVGQVREAYRDATELRSIGPNLHALFQRSLSVAKRIQTETGLSRGRLSIASAAIDYIANVFDVFTDKTVLVIGAGKMAELTLTHLVERQPGRILLCNRNVERAAALAAQYGGETIPFDRLHEALIAADIVISSTAATEPIVRAEEFDAIMEARQQRLMAIVDIAVPRDFDTAIGQVGNVLLWNIDDLEKVRFQTLRAREKELDRALSIVTSEADAFQVSMAVQQSGPVIGRLDREIQRIIDQELEWLMPQLAGAPEETRQKIRHFAHRVKNKLLHPPKAALRNRAKSGDHHGLIDALRKLFGLDDGDARPAD